MIELNWDTGGVAEWRKCLHATGWSTLEQSWAFGEAVAATSGARVRRAMAHDGNSHQAIVQTIEKPLGRLTRIVRIVRGPLLLNGARTAAVEPIFQSIRRAMRRPSRSLLFWLPELAPSDANHAVMRACGARRVVTGYSTVRIDLRQDLERLRAGLHGKWRNGLCAAERHGLRIRAAHGGATLDGLLREYDGLRRKKHFSGHSSRLLKAVAAHSSGSAKDVTVISAHEGSDMAAAALFLRHGQTATYTAAWSADAGRAANAPRLVLWHGIEALRAQGLAWLDLGGVNTNRAPGLARFKLGLGGEVITLAGTYF